MFRENHKIAGIIAIGFTNQYLSFVDQVRYQSNGRFSYRIPTANQETGNVLLTCICKIWSRHNKNKWFITINKNVEVAK